MASGIVAPSPPEGPQSAPPPACEAFIDQRLRQTRRQLKGVDVAGGLMTLAAGTLAYLMFAAVLDHWVVAGGLGFAARLLLLLGLAAGAGAYSAFCVLPPLVRRINPVFAAQTIEQGRPTLKNSLINFLLLRNHRQEVAPIVYRAWRIAPPPTWPTHTAKPPSIARIVRLGYVLLVLVAALALYVVFSPKNPLVSFGRIIWPWSTAPAPTRVTIDDVRPGDAVAFHDDTLEVSAGLSGLRDGEPVTLYYSTADGQSVDQPLAMSPLGEGNRYHCTLPPGNLGLQQDVRYVLAAGDCRTRAFHVEVQIAPTIAVDKVDYHYPAYTGMADRTAPGQGDLRPWKGRGRPFTRPPTTTSSGRKSTWIAAATAACEWTPPAARPPANSRCCSIPQDPSRPQHESYQLLFTDADGRSNRRPIRYHINVVRDLPPDVKFLRPEEDEVQIAADGRLEIRVSAQDPDFGLRRVFLRAGVRGAKFVDPTAPGQGAARARLPRRIPGELLLRAGPTGVEGGRSRRLLGRSGRQQGAGGESVRDRPADDRRCRGQRRATAGQSSTSSRPHRRGVASGGEGQAGGQLQARAACGEAAGEVGTGGKAADEPEKSARGKVEARRKGSAGRQRPAIRRVGRDQDQ